MFFPQFTIALFAQAYDAPKKHAARAVTELSRSRLGARAERSTAYFSEKLLKPEVCCDKRVPFQRRSFLKRPLDLGKIWLPRRKLQEAAPCIRRALLRGRDLRLECKPTAVYSAARHIALCLAWKSAAQLKASLKRQRRSN